MIKQQQFWAELVALVDKHASQMTIHSQGLRWLLEKDHTLTVTWYDWDGELAHVLPEWLEDIAFAHTGFTWKCRAFYEGNGKGSAHLEENVSTFKHLSVLDIPENFFSHWQDNKTWKDYAYTITPSVWPILALCQMVVWATEHRYLEQCRFLRMQPRQITWAFGYARAGTPWEVFCALWPQLAKAIARENALDEMIRMTQEMGGYPELE